MCKLKDRMGRLRWRESERETCIRLVVTSTRIWMPTSDRWNFSTSVFNIILHHYTRTVATELVSGLDRFVGGGGGGDDDVGVVYAFPPPGLLVSLSTLPMALCSQMFCTKSNWILGCCFCQSCCCLLLAAFCRSTTSILVNFHAQLQICFMFVSSHVFLLPKFWTLHGNSIVSPTMALYKCPLDTNFGTTVGESWCDVGSNSSKFWQ